MGFSITGTPTEVTKISAALDDVLPDKEEKKKEDKSSKGEQGGEANQG